MDKNLLDALHFLRKNGEQFVTTENLITDLSCIKKGALVIMHRPYARDSIDVQLIVSAVGEYPGDKQLSDDITYFSLDFAPAGFGDVLLPELHFVGDSGMAPYVSGRMHDDHRSYLVPFSIRDLEIDSLVAAAKTEWESLIARRYDTFNAPHSPFV